MKKGKVFIVAEAGINHNGSVKCAKMMIDAAKSAGADAIKFQTFKAESLVTKCAPKAEYQISTTKHSETQYEMLKSLELDLAAHRALLQHCNKKHIRFLSSPFDLESIELLHKLGLEIFKIPSGEITNLPYLERIGSLDKEIIMSTGMANLKEVADALGVLIKSGTNKNKITLLHSNTEYPTPYEDVNLKAMLSMKNKFGLKTGYSDHTQGIAIAIAAAALEASVIEKHFTMDKKMHGPDHRVSACPEEFLTMVRAIRNIERALGNGIKKPSKSEKKNIGIVRKSIIASRRIDKDEVFSKDNLTTKRPGDGISPMLWNVLLGKKAKRDYGIDQKISLR